MKTPVLYDYRGRPIKRTELKREVAAPTLTGVRTLWDGETVAQGLTPQRLAQVMRDAADGDAREYLLLAEEMEEREMHYASVMSTRKRAVAGIEPNVIPASDDPKDIEIADAVKTLVEQPEFSILVTDLLDGLGKGYAVCEIMWDLSGSQWTPREYLWRDPRFFVFDRESRQKLRLLDETASFEGRSLPPFKFITHMPHLKSGIPIRSGLARLAAVSWMCKNYTMADWMAFAEVFGMPLRVGRYGENATDRDKEILARAVANIGMDAAAIVPETMRIEFIEAAKAAGGQDLFLNIAKYLDGQISKGVLGQTMTTDDGSSQSQAEVHNDVRLDIKNDDGKQVGATVNRDLVIPFVDLNYGVQDRYPRVRIHEEEAEDITALADALGKIVPLGNSRISARAVRERLGFPEPEDESDILGPPAMNTGSPEAALNRAMRAFSRAMNRSGAVDADEMDLLADEALADWEPAMSPLINPVLDLAERCSDYDEFLAGLGEIAREMDAETLVRSMAEATFKARGLGDAE